MLTSGILVLVFMLHIATLFKKYNLYLLNFESNLCFLNIDKDSVMTMLQFLDSISKISAIRWWNILVEKYEWFSTVNWLCFRIIFMLHVTAVIKKISFNILLVTAILSQHSCQGFFLRLCFFLSLQWSVMVVHCFPAVFLCPQFISSD